MSDAQNQPSEAASDAAVSSSRSSDRRSFLAKSAGWAMGGGLIASYGTLAAYAVRYLLPPDPEEGFAWQFVAPLEELPVGHAVEYVAPSGEPIVIARQVDDQGKDRVQALSSVCPHLGCRVHWESAKNHFFCPCHNGIFDRDGVATAGPPAKARQRLKQYETQIVQGLLFIKVRMTGLNA